MADLLLELFSEEIPAGLQARGADELKKRIVDGLKQAGCDYDEALAYATPRRLALSVTGLPERQPDVKEERKGPRVGAPDKAIEGFLGSTGLSLDQCEIRDDKKGQFYVAVIDKPGRPTPDVIAELVPAAVTGFSWPKSMRWGAGSMRWVRPLHSILCLFDGAVVDFEVGGIRSGALTRGHRFHAPGELNIKSFDDYRQRLRDAHVVLDPEERAWIILDNAKTLAQNESLELVEDGALLRENAGLNEWPVPLIGTFDEDFLAVPPEVLTTSMKSHQKYFSVRDPKTGKLANRFIMVCQSGGRRRRKGDRCGQPAGHRRAPVGCPFLLGPRPQDQARGPSRRSRTHHLPRAPRHPGREGRASGRARRRDRRPDRRGPGERRAGGAALQMRSGDRDGRRVPGIAGPDGPLLRAGEGADRQVADAIAQHYQPQGPSDAVPEGPVAQAVALADKIDTLVGFWAIDEKPTGSKDPYALRRAALGVVRIVLENEVRLHLSPVIQFALARIGPTLDRLNEGGDRKVLVRAVHDAVLRGDSYLLAFFADRLKVHLRDQGARHDLIDAVFALGGQDDLLMIVRRVEALGSFLETDDGANLLAGVKRAQNILRIEEKKDGASHDGTPDAALFAQDEERALAAAIADVERDAGAAVAGEDFEAAMSALARLRGPVDAFFDNVTVNADDAALRTNRLKLLSRIRTATHQVADFSRIES